MDGIQIYTDGACSGNPGPGAYAFIILKPCKVKELQYSGFYPRTTNIEMEITAAARALFEVSLIIKSSDNYNSSTPVELYSDSKYVTDGISSWMHSWAKNGWKKEIAHKKIWQNIYEICRCINVKTIWVKGHADNKYNNKCDKIATNLIK
ncbi:MAG: ribonuclease H family protein [bacterium]